MSLSKRLRKMPDVRNLLRDIRRGLFSDNCIQLMDEVERLHSVRKVRQAQFHKLSKKRVEQMMLEDTATRSRLAEIGMIGLRKRRTLEIRVEAVRERIFTEYGRLLKESYSNAEERNGAIATLLAEVMDRIRQYELLEDFSEVVITDIDKGAWNLSRLNDGFTLETKRGV